VAIYAQLLTAFGNAVGHQATFEVEQTMHHVNLFIALVGLTSRGRKGTSLDYAKRIFWYADPRYTAQLAGGLSTGEGLIWAVRDPIYKMQQDKKTGACEDVLIDRGIDDKRLLVIESEFARPLRAMSRPTNILSEVIRQAWDSGDLRIMTRNEATRATGAHVALISHITKEELKRELSECEFFNGFANRFLWFEVERSKLLPDGGRIDRAVMLKYASELTAVLARAREVEEMKRADDAKEYWHTIYEGLTKAAPGMLGAVTSRAEAQVLRLSMVLALTDGSDTIQLAHLKAALALWQYCCLSAERLFGSRLLDIKAQQILDELRRRPQGMTRREISDEIFGRNVSSERIATALRALLDIRLAYSKIEPTNGRDAEKWFAR
jgi:hypothetical protein